MKTLKSLSLSLAFAFAIAGVSASAFAADQAQDAYNAYNQKVAPIERQLYAKEAELDALYGNAQPDTDKAQQLFREIGELKGQLFAAEAEIRSQLGNAGASYGGMHHPGEFPQDDYGYRGHRGGGGMRHGGGHHGGW